MSKKVESVVGEVVSVRGVKSAGSKTTKAKSTDVVVVKQETDLIAEEKILEIQRIKEGLASNKEKRRNFGSNIVAELSDLNNSEVLNSMRLKDLDEGADGQLMKLYSEMNKIDYEKLLEKKSFLPPMISKLFGIDNVKKAITSFKTGEEIIKDVETALVSISFELEKDTIAVEKIINKALKGIDKLEKHIEAGKLFIKEEEERLAIAKEYLKDQENSTGVENFYELQVLNNDANDLKIFKSHLSNLEMNKEAAKTNIVTYWVLKDSNESNKLNIKNIKESAIPQWRSATAAMIYAERQKTTLEFQKNIIDTVNKTIASSAQTVADNAIEVARQSGSTVIDPKVLIEANRVLKDAIKQVIEINKNGEKIKQEQIKVLVDSTKNLNEEVLKGLEESKSAGAEIPKLEKKGRR